MKIHNLNSADLAWMSIDQIKEMLSEAYNGKVVNDDPEWTVIEIDWSLSCSEEYLHPNMFVVLSGLTYKVYITLVPDDFMVIRNKSEEVLEELFKIFKRKYISLKREDVTNNGKVNSLIVTGKQMYDIHMSLTQIPKGKQSHKENGRNYLLNKVCGGDVTFNNKPFSYNFDLIIGTHLEIEKIRIDGKSHNPTA